jgi:hypothetical protein
MDGTVINDALRGPTLERLEPRLLLSAGVAPELVSVQWRGETAMARADEWIIRLDDSEIGSSAIKGLQSSLADGGLETGTIKSIGQSQFSLLKAPGLSAKQVIAWAGKQSNVLYAEPNFVYTISETIDSTFPDDPMLADGVLWGLHNDGQFGGTVDADIDAPEAWELTTGSAGVVLAVIDTGGHARFFL